MIHPWQVTSTDPVADCRVFQVRREDCRHPGTGREAGFFILGAPDWINVVAVTPQDELVLVRQYRHGIKDFTLEIPGGMVDPGETPLEAARRELREESGYEAAEWVDLGFVEPNPAILENRCHTFLARDAVKVAEPSPDGNEEFEQVRRPVSEMFSLVRDGSIRHSLVICAFHAYALHVGRL